jgi:hypothetical protein
MIFSSNLDMSGNLGSPYGSQSQRAASLLSPASSRERGFTLRNAIGRCLTATVVVGALFAAASPAITAQAAAALTAGALNAQQQARAAARNIPGMKAVPDAVGDESQICLTNAPSYCIKTNGAGNQVTITNVAANKANFTVVYDSVGVHAWQDGNGNCLREGTGGVVKIENGPCNIHDASDLWYHSQGSTEWYNVSNDYVVYTTGHVTGDDVWTALTAPSGSWSEWNAPT